MIRLPHSRKNLLFILLFLNFVLFGASMTVFGATLPTIIRTLDWSYWVAGVIIASNSFAYFVTTFISGLMAHRIGLRRLMISGLLLQAIGIGLFGMFRNIPFNAAAFILVGTGQGAIEIVTNYSVVGMERPGQSRLMNLVHSAFTIGATVAPFITGALIGIEIGWRSIYLSFAVASLLMMGAFTLQSVSFIEPEREPESKGMAGLKTLHQPILLLLALTMFLYVGAEIGISSWISEFFVTQFALAPSTSAYMVSLFWLGIFAGRLATSFLYKGDRQTHVLFAFSVFSALSLALALFIRQAAVSAAFFLFAGLGFSTIYPTVMTIVSNRYPSARGVSIGVISTAGGIGMCVFPLIMAGIADLTSIRNGFWFYLLLTVVMTAISAILFWKFGRSNRRA